MLQKSIISWNSGVAFKGKSSQSDYEENNNSNNSNNHAVRVPRADAAIASKSAEEATAVAATIAVSTTTSTASKDLSSKEDQPRSAGNAGPGRKGRLKKGQRGRKCLNIAELDVLHKQTVWSTSLDAMTKKMPAAPGTVDQQLTSLLRGDMSHRELDIPVASQDTPYSLQILLDVFRSQYMNLIEHMRSSAYLPQVQKQIAQEQERMARLKNRASQLDNQIKVLIDDSVTLLKVRMNELGINVNSPNDLIAPAKEIVGRHKDLQHAFSKMRNEVTVYESEQKLLLSKQLKHLPEYEKLCTIANGGNGKVKLELPHELSETAAQGDCQYVHSNSSNICCDASSAQEWPEVPEVGKIQESNPEVLAQKILETCHQVEAGKFQSLPAPAPPTTNNNPKQRQLCTRTAH
ncbi:hypothetical protein ACLKA7_007649 [Drosophila subpalustris]